MTFQIALFLVCGLAVTLGSVMSHTSVYVPHQSKYSTRIIHDPEKPRPIRSSVQWHISRDNGRRITQETHKVTRDRHKISQESHSISQEIDLHKSGRIEHTPRGFEPPTGYSYSSVSKHEKGGSWSRVDVQIGSYHIPTSYSSFNLYSTK